MSSKTKPTATNEETKPALVPKLRFPEFRGTNDWESTRLGELCEVITKGSTPTSYGFDYVESGVRFVKIESLSGGFVDCSKTAYITEECNASFFRSQLKENDILFSIAGALGVIAIVDSNILPANINQAIGIIRLKNEYSHWFLLHQLQADLIQAEIQRIKAGAAQPNISLSQLGDFMALLPSPAEQQKIAECLSSVDELIAAQARKLDALKTHKKGMMQQLFPREGETQPRLRFPEFQNAGDWVEEELSKCLKKVIDYRGKAPPKSESGVPLITAKNVRFGWLDMANDEYIEEEKYDEWMSRGIPLAGDILFTTEAPLGNVALFPLEGKFALGQRLLTLRAKPDRCVPAFLFHSLLGLTMQEDIDFHGTGSTAKGIKSKVFVKLSFCHPGVQEQQRIADCLTSLDDLIAAQTQTLEALKTHKQGLMQQLFPAPEGVNA